MSPPPVKMEYDPIALILAQNRAINALTEKIGELERKIEELRAMPMHVGGGMRQGAADDRYLQLSGVNPMTGNLDMADNLIKFADVQLRQYPTASTYLEIFIPPAGRGDLVLDELSAWLASCEIINARVNVADFRCVKDHSWQFRAQDAASAWHVCATLAVDNFALNRAGDITFADTSKKLIWDDEVQLTKSAADYTLKVTDSGGTASSVELYDLYVENMITTIAGTFKIGSVSHISMTADGELNMTAGARFEPHRISQSAMPTPGQDELLMWRDTDDDKVYLVYQDPDVGTKAVELPL